MNNPYDLHSWSQNYREERHAEARRHQLEGRLQEERKVRSGWRRVGLALANALALLGAAGRARTW